MARRNIFSRAPATPIEHLWYRVQNDYLHLPDPGPFYALMGAVAANMMTGAPVWLMLVGPPAAGGSELLNTLLGIPCISEAGMIESPAAFLSGTPAKDKSKDATGGLLREIGDCGGLVIKDFTSILSLNRETQRKILAVLREIYDGRWTRPIGSDGGKSMNWEGKIGVFAKVTSVIDQNHEANGALGERWVYYRFEETDSFERTRRAISNSNIEGWREDLRALVSGFFLGEGLDFLNPVGHRILNPQETARIIHLGDVASRCRSAVVRDVFNKEILGVRETETGPRISTVLSQLFLGMEYIGVPNNSAWYIIRKIALDSMPRMRRVVIEAVRPKTGVMGSELIRKIGASKNVVRRTCEDLEVHGVVEVEKIGNDFHVRMRDEMREEFRKGWGWR